MNILYIIRIFWVLFVYLDTFPVGIQVSNRKTKMKKFLKLNENNVWVSLLIFWAAAYDKSGLTHEPLLLDSPVQIKLWKSSKLNFLKYHAQKNPKICTGYRVSAAKIYLYHSTEIAKARPHWVGIS